MKKIHWILFAILAISVSSCYKIDRYHLNAVSKQMIPYQLGNKVFFINEEGDSVALMVANVKDKWDIEDEAFSEVRVQYRHVELVSENDKYQFIFQTYAESPNYLNRLFRIYLEKPYNFDLQTSYDAKGNVLSRVVLDSLSMDDKIYYDVAEFNKTYGNGTVQHTMQCRYNKEYGLLQLKIDGKTHLQRIP